MTRIKIDWPEPSGGWTIAEETVYIWAADLTNTGTPVAEYSQTLSPDELERAKRFRFERHRDRFIAGRGWLRAVLATYLQTYPGEIQFEYSQRGKPGLKDASAGLHFNLTHCEDLALLAVTRTCPVGVDVERARALGDADDIAVRFFSTRESEGLKSLPDAEKPVAFFNLWTRKEAWLKATGEGLSESLNQVEVSFLAGEPARLVRLFGKSDSVRQWTIAGLMPAVEFIGALAAPAPNLKTICGRWPARAG